jgi:hypothetical protein
MGFGPQPSGCIQHGDIVNKAFGISGKPHAKRKASRFVNGYNLATKHFDFSADSIIKSNKALTCSLNL